MNARLAAQLDKLSSGAVDEIARAVDDEIGGDEDYDTHEIALRAYESLIAAGYRIVQP